MREDAAAVRQEYAWMEDGAWRARRAAVLRRFLARERIYGTPAIAAEREARGRKNLATELSTLARGGDASGAGG